MNYFAHGYRFTDRPYFLAGTAVPDWLSVADRRVRMRARRVEPFADGSGTPRAEVAAGILRHLDDDGWFHRTRAFHEVTGEVTRMFRALPGTDEGFRPSFLGHIVTELILDGVLISRDPDRLHDYYRALGELDPHLVQQAVNEMARDTTERLAPLIPLFRQERFLWDYLEPPRLLFRLNQVMRRIKLNPLPAGTEAVLEAAWEVVASRSHELMSANGPVPDDPA